jgi:hypothetical protein
MSTRKAAQGEESNLKYKRIFHGFLNCFNLKKRGLLYSTSVQSLIMQFCIVPSSKRPFSVESNSTYYTNYYTTINALLYIVFILKLALKHLKSSYMFRSIDHHHGAHVVPC